MLDRKLTSNYSRLAINARGGMKVIDPIYSAVRVLIYYIIAGPREARNPNLDSDQRISYYACVPYL